MVRFRNLERNTVVCERGFIAQNAWTRGMGLLGRKSLPSGEGLFLAPGAQIHMFGMKFPLDVIFLTRDDTVADLVENLAVGKLYSAKPRLGRGKALRPWGALELPVGTIAGSATKVGDKLVREHWAPATATQAASETR